TGKTLQIIQRAFFKRTLAGYVIQDAQLGPRETRRVQDPVHECFRVVLVTQTVKRADGESRIAEPGKAIIPIRIGAKGFGQRSGGSSDDGAGRRKREKL